MAVTPKALIEVQQLTASAATYYTSTNIVTIIDSFKLVNVDTVARTATVSIGANAGGTQFIVARSLAPGECYNCPEMVGQILNAGDLIQALADSANKVNIRASGRQVSGVS
jgi:hypothetical protein